MGPVNTLEIVELSNGEFILRRADSKDEAIIRIGFSDEALTFLGQSKLEVCKAMIGTGIKLAGKLNRKQTQVDFEYESDTASSDEYSSMDADRVLH